MTIGIRTPDGMLYRIPGKGGPIHNLAFLNGGFVVGTRHDGRLIIWDLSQPSLPKDYAGHDRASREVTIGPDGALATGGDDDTIKLRKLNQSPVTLEDSGVKMGWTRALAFGFSRIGKFLASAGDDDGMVRIWNIELNEIFRRIQIPFTVGTIHALDFSPDGLHLAVGGRDGILRVIQNVVERTFDNSADIHDSRKVHTSYIRSIKYSPDGRLIATGGRGKDGRILLWGSENTNLVHEMRDSKLEKAHEDDVNSIDFLGHRFIVSASDDKTVKVWNARSGLLVYTLSGPRPFTAARFSPDGAFVVAVDDRQNIRMLDMNTGEEISARPH
jgi:WD40 repeat protein